MLKHTLAKLNIILGKYPLPNKNHRDLLMMAAFDKVVICEANMYEVMRGKEFAKIAVVESNPINCHSIIYCTVTPKKRK